MEGAIEIDPHDLVPGIGGHGKCVRRTRDSGVGDEEVDGAESSLDGIEHHARLIAVPDVGAVDLADPAIGPDIVAGRFGRLPVGREIDRDARAARGEPEADRPPDATRSARHQGGASREFLRLHGWGSSPRAPRR